MPGDPGNVGAIGHNASVLLDELVRTSVAVTATSSRRAKIEAIANLLRRAGPDEVPVAVAFLAGELRQRQIGVGYAALRDMADASGGSDGSDGSRASGDSGASGDFSASRGSGGSGAPAASGDSAASVDPAASGDSAAARDAPVPKDPAAVRDSAASGSPTDSGASTGAAPVLTLTAVDAAFAQIGAATGPGSQAERRRLLAALFSGASGPERSFLVRLLAGDLRQGALEGVMVEAIAAAAEVPAEEVRRAHMLGGSLLAVAAAALASHEQPPGAPLPGAIPAGAPHPGASAAAAPVAVAPQASARHTRAPPDGAPDAGAPDAGAPDPGAPDAGAAEAGAADAGAHQQRGALALAALRSFRLEVGRPLRPMLAGSADSVGAALARVRPAAVEWKIDGIRVQVHRDGAEVTVFTRTLDDITSRVPEVVAAAAALPAQRAVLDGEIVALGPDGRPRPFQVTAGRTGNRSDVSRLAAQVPLTAFFFDLLHLDGADLVDSPGSYRYARLADIVPGDLLIPRIVTAQDSDATAFFDDAVARGHEGVLVKSLDAPYAAGRRGFGWIKVKPRHTLDLIVIAAEWGHGRRRGWLSNLHLAARDPDTGGHVMLGKTFKGLTDEILTWQTQRLLELADPPRSRSGPSSNADWVVKVRPELVVEIAFDGVQASPRYPGGLALRFARVIRYRPDKRAADADTIATIRQIAAASGISPDQVST
jgi:ATP-dependent DNA ligase